MFVLFGLVAVYCLFLGVGTGVSELVERWWRSRRGWRQ